MNYDMSQFDKIDQIILGGLERDGAEIVDVTLWKRPVNDIRSTEARTEIGAAGYNNMQVNFRIDGEDRSVHICK